MKKLPGTVAIICIICALATSCKKKDSNTNTNPATSAVKDMLVGNWKLSQYADDDNSNGQLDDNEKYSPGSGESGLVVYKADGTGLISYISPGDTESYNLTWVLQNSDQELKVMAPGLDTTTQGIKSITATDLTVLDDITDPRKSWTIFKKM